jgi:hypothetical protein
VNRALKPLNHQRQVWRGCARIVEYKYEEDGDLHIVLFDRGSYIIAEMSAAHSLAGARARRSFAPTAG